MSDETAREGRPNVRDVARRFIEGVLNGEPGAEDMVAAEAADLGPEDRGLFQELTHGALREWLFLDWIIGKYAPKAPRPAIRTILNLSAYQLLFLTRVPDYAIFSQAAAISSALGVSEPELRFIHGVLKSVQKSKDKLLEMRDSSLTRARQGLTPEGALEWATLNAPSALLDALTVVEEKGQKKAARSRAVRALAAMKERAQLVGYALPGGQPRSEIVKLESEVAPLALMFKGGPQLAEDLRAGTVRIQGEASQWACALAAQWIEKRRNQPKLRVLEMATGKGGKLLGTLAALTATWGGNREAVPALEWWATDISLHQLRVFERDTAELVRRLWPQTELHCVPVDWRRPEEAADRLPADFDLIWLDAPCTGFGTIEKLPQIALTRGRNAYDEALRMGELQQALCETGLKRLRPGGSLIYSVCTLTRPETFGVLEHCAAKLDRRAAFARGLWPGSAPAPDAEGFFVAFL